MDVIAQTQRIITLDVLRGVAVLGILLMNVIAFAYPGPAYINPRAWGGMSSADQWAWLANFILVEAKMRALFSILFGASMLLFIEQVQARGQLAGPLHFRRMFWLLVFGWLHFAFIWDGDILILYAAIGAVAWFARDLSIKALIKAAILVLACNALLWGAIIGENYSFEVASHKANASKKTIERVQNFRNQYGEPGSPRIKEDLERFRSSYARILSQRVEKQSGTPLNLIIFFGWETLGLMLLGMAFLKNGFLIGQRSLAYYLRFAALSLGFSLPLMTGLGLWCSKSDFDILTTAAATLLWSVPFHAPIALGYAALIIAALKKGKTSSLFQRLAAVGQTAFSNYILMSVLMTMLFYGYGFGLYGKLSRWHLYLLVPCVWLVLLAWSKPWMRKFHYGPLEWAWRMLTRGQWIPLRRSV